MTKLTISIVTYSPDLVVFEKVIDSLKVAITYATSHDENLKTKVEIINNNFLDTSKGDIERYMMKLSSKVVKTSFIDSSVNGGYGAGNNISIHRNQDADFHLVLNPDVLVSKESIHNGLIYLKKNSDIGLLTPQVRGFDGEMHYLCKMNPTLFDGFVRGIIPKYFRSLFLTRNYYHEMRDYDYSKVIKPVEYPTGCFMLFRVSILKLIGGFDEGYFLHYEDADMGRMISKVSQTAYVPDVLVLHKWARESHKSIKMRWITIKSGFRYWRKWGGII